MEFKNVKIGDFDGLRGIEAKYRMEGREVLVTVPSEAVLEVTNAGQRDTPFADFVAQQVWENNLWDGRLAFKLLYEAKVQGETSNKKAWMASLPRKFSTPLHWTGSAVAETQYPALRASVVAQKKLWRSLYNTWQSHKLAAAAVVSYDDFVWAMENVNSRAFSGIYEGSTSTERRNLLLFTGLLTILWPLVGFGTYEQSLNAAVAVGVSIVLRDIFLSKSANLKRYVVCPMIDMFNHKSTSTAEVSFNYFSGKFEVMSGETEKYEAGDQVFITYGKQGNDRLLQYYGFVEQDNVYDSYDFGDTFLGVFIKYGDKVNAAVPLPADASDAIKRLQTLTSALQNSGTLEGSQAGSGKERSGKKSAISAIDTNVRYYRNTRTFDDVSTRCLRALYASAQEWQLVTDSRGMLALDALHAPLSAQTEKAVRRAQGQLAQLELESKASRLEDDEAQLRVMVSGRSKDKSGGVVGSFSVGFGGESPSKVVERAKSSVRTASTVDPSGRFKDTLYTAVAFRIEKKKLLLEASRLGLS